MTTVFSLADSRIESRLRDCLLAAIRAGHDEGADVFAAQILDHAARLGIANGATVGDVLLAGAEMIETSRALDRRAALDEHMVADGELVRVGAATRKRRSLIAVEYSALLALDIPPRRALLGRWLMQQSLNMIHARRGTGKTHVALGIAWAVATGGVFLGWRADEPHRVLFVDGELPARVLQDRLREIEQRNSAQPAAGNLRFITPDLLGRAAPDLASLTDQAELDELADCADLLILDNLSALIRSGAAENDAESWVTVSDWALRHRAAGRSIIFIHHSGKSGSQRGTSRREDLLDSVISLRNPQDYDPTNGARFEVHFEKARHLAGCDVEPFEATLDATAPGGWAIESIEANIDEQIVERLGLGLSLTDIGRELSLHKSNISRRVRDLRAKGVLPADGSGPQQRNPTRNTGQKKLAI